MNKIKPVAIFLIVLMPLFYIFSTLYIALKFHLYLPAADLIGRHEILLDAYKNGITGEIFSLHNTFHWIVLPKIILSLDMMWLQGSGWLIKWAAIIFFLLTIVLLVKAIYKTPSISVYQKHLLAILAVALMGGSWNRESLNSPISQYSMICFFLLVLAYLIAYSRNSLVKKAGVGSSALLLLMSSGQIVALLPALILARYKQYLSKVMLAVLALLFCYAVVELLLIICLKKTPLLFIPYSFIGDREQLAQTLAYFWTDPLQIFLSVWRSISYFMAKFTFPQIYDLLSEFQLKAAALAFYIAITAVFIRYKSVWEGDKIWLICFLFCFINALLPAFLRMSDGYGNRFANLSSLMMVSAMMLFVLHRRGKYTSWVIAIVAGYMLLILPHTYHTLEKENHGLLGASAIKPQVAYSIGLRDPDLIVSAPGAWWRETDSQGIYAFYTEWKEHRLGVFSSEAYKVFAGDISFPAEKKQCDYQLSHVFWRVWQAEHEVAVYVKGSASAADDYVSNVVFYDMQSGKAVGRAVRDVAKPLADLLFKPDSWDGFVKLNEFKSTQLKLVAYGRDFRCQSFVINIHP